MQPSVTSCHRRPNYSYRGGGVTIYRTQGVTRYVKSSTRIRYPLLPLIYPDKIMTTSLALLRKLRGEKMRVERRRIAHVVRQVGEGLEEG